MFLSDFGHSPRASIGLL